MFVRKQERLFSLRNKTNTLKKDHILKFKIPLMRFGAPEEISGPVAFLLSNESSYIHGSNIVVDGGWTAI